MRHLSLCALLLPLCALACKPAEAPAAPREPAPVSSSTAAPAEAAPAETAAPAEADARAAASAIVAAPDRGEEDRVVDAQRKPIELLAFLDLKPGMRAAELMAGFGYTAELLARAVGPSGQVFGQNNRFVLERFAEKGWSDRLAKPVMKPVQRVDRELDDPLPPEAKDLDAVLMVLFYHDTVWMKVDRARMNKAIFAALKPGGSYVIVDHSGRSGTGVSEAQTLHRIEAALVRKEVEAAGFRLAAEGEFLRHPEDPMDWNASPRAAEAKGLRGESDRFVFKFVKP
nr:SAM-dependent methyltransferase [Nannocystis sp.]